MFPFSARGGKFSALCTTLFTKKQGTTLEGVLDIGNNKVLSATIKKLRFDQCAVTSQLIAANDAWTVTMEDCEFESCTTTAASLISGKASGISRCVFNLCQAQTYLLDIQSLQSGFTLSYVSFTGITNTGSLINIRNLNDSPFNHLSMNHCVLSDLTMSGQALVVAVSTTFQVDITNLTVTECEISTICGLTGAARIQESHFTGDVFREYLFQPSARFELSECEFNDCSGPVVKSLGSGAIIISGCNFTEMKESSESMINIPSGSISISGTTFDGCSCTNDALISINSVTSFSLRDCCFLSCLSLPLTCTSIVVRLLHLPLKRLVTSM